MESTVDVPRPVSGDFSCFLRATRTTGARLHVPCKTMAAAQALTPGMHDKGWPVVEIIDRSGIVLHRSPPRPGFRGDCDSDAAIDVLATAE